MLHLRYRIVVSLFVFCSFLTARASAQSSQRQPQPETQSQLQAQMPAASTETPPTQTPPRRDVRILFTGRLLGYLGLPDKQPARPNYRGCPKVETATSSEAVRRFLKSMESLRNADDSNDDALVVGMGDNFAPAVSARWLFPPDAKEPTLDRFSPSKDFRPSKDMNTWDWLKREWIPLKDEADYKKNVTVTVQTDILKGLGYIETDNVGCFLKTARYDAIVPGVEDFYFGPERLRYLARFLATPLSDYGKTPVSDDDKRTVQMLAANLVIQTTYAEPRTPLPDADKGLKYQTSDEGLAPENFGKFVLPWLQHIVFKLQPDESAKKNQKPVESAEEKQRDFYLCETKAGLPDQIPSRDGIAPLKENSLKEHCVKITTILQGGKYDVELPELDSLKAGSSYAICTKATKVPNGSPEIFCTRFSVYSPFFLYPDKAFHEFKEGDPYADPQPYFLNNKGWKKEGGTVAVFGVVDPNLRNYVGELNAAWENKRKEYKTEVAVLDPAEALDQQLQYFERKYRAQNCGNKFSGVKVLLAQMAPPLARQLAARLHGKFDVVISEADSEQATPNETVTIMPLAEDLIYKFYEALHGEQRKSRQGTVNEKPTFVAVPPPYFDTEIEHPVLQIRQLDIKRPVPATETNKQRDVEARSFTVSGTRKVEELAGEDEPLPIEKITENGLLPALKAQLESDLALKVNAPEMNATQSKKNLVSEKNLVSLTLFVLKKKFKADVALMQERDFYFGQPPKSVGPGMTPAEWLERILWKGDLAAHAMVKGSTLLKVLQQSAGFEAQDEQPLSLEVVKGRQLITLGIFHDKLRDEYLVNGEMLDKDRLYSVATTDYIGAGDTGYPDIAEPGFDNPQIPKQFPKTLYQISSLVCEALQKTPGAPCLSCYRAEIARDPYLDASNDQPLDKGPFLTDWRRFERWTNIPFIFQPERRFPKPRKQLSNAPVELSAQDRRVFSISHSSSISLTATDNSVSEAQRKAFFSGISSPSELQAKESHEVNLTLKERFGLSGRVVDFYFQPELSYDNVVTGQSVPPAVSNLKQNLAAGEIGLFLHLDRDLPRLGLLISVRDESQLQHPIDTVTLADTNKTTLTFDQARANFVFGHFGFRVQNRHSFFEAGFQVGGVRRLTAFNFTTSGDAFSCPFAATADAQDEPACVAANSDDSPGKTPAITKSSTPSAVLGSALRYGWFSNMQLLVPLNSLLSYSFSNKFDYFYAGQGSISTDMLFRDLWSNSLSFQITRNVAVASTFDVFFYQNQVKHNSFRQVQTSISIKYAFDWFSGSRWKTAVQYTKPK